MELDEIIKLIDKVSNSDLDSFVYEKGDLKLHLKNKEVLGSEISYSQVAPKATAVDEGKFKYIESPLVGVFYSYNSELGEPYVSVGERVTEGQVVGIIEAMKLMNEVCSTVSGVVEEIIAENDQTVEYGQLLIKIREE